MTELLDILANPAFWIATLRVATPLILGTLGVLLCERAGVLNLGDKDLSRDDYSYNEDGRRYFMAVDYRF